MMSVRKYILVCLLAFNCVAAFPQLLVKKGSAQDYYKQVFSYFVEQRWGEGKSILDKALKKYPEDADLNYLAGRFWWNSGNPDIARKYLLRSYNKSKDQLDTKRLLLTLESETGNYSAAICYANELLETTPYDKTLWTKIIELYMLQSNATEVSRMLKRLTSIYPNDKDIHEYCHSILETNYRKYKAAGENSKEISTLEEIIQGSPYGEEYRLPYVNLILAEGQNEKAIEYLYSEIRKDPHDYELCKKLCGTLIYLGREKQALNFIEQHMEKYPDPKLLALRKDITDEYARISSRTDGYAIYKSMLGKNSKDRTALDYLRKESILRGYYDDALYFISLERQNFGDSRKLLLDEYKVYNRSGNKDAARRLRESLFKKYKDYDIAMDLCMDYLESANSLIQSGTYPEALPYAHFVVNNAPDEDMRMTAFRRVLACYMNMENKQDAMDSLSKVIKDKGVLLPYRIAAEDAYKNIAYKLIKDNIQDKNFREAERLNNSIFAISPEDSTAMHNAVSITSGRKDRDAMALAISRGERAYPHDSFFKIKRATQLSEDKHYRPAIQILENVLSGATEEEEAVRMQYVGTCALFAEDLIKRKQIDSAQIIVCKGLCYAPDNKELLYARGRIYENLKEYDKAYEYQKYYNPSLTELAEYKNRMSGLKNRSYKNIVSADYSHIRFSDSDLFMGVGNISYTRISDKKNSFTGRISYTSRDAKFFNESGSDFVTGGRGYKLQALWEHNFNKNWSSQVTISWANRYFHNYSLSGSLTNYAEKEWELQLHAIVSRLADGNMMFGIGPAAYKTIDNFRFGGKITGGIIGNRFYYSAMLKGQFYYLEDRHSHIDIITGAGNAPELELMNYYSIVPEINRVNSFAGLAATKLITDNLMLGLSANWSTLYYYSAKELFYRNLIDLNLSVTLAF